jgi:hypothetical protein
MSSPGDRYLPNIFGIYLLPLKDGAPKPLLQLISDYYSPKPLLQLISDYYSPKPLLQLISDYYSSCLAITRPYKL